MIYLPDFSFNKPLPQSLYKRCSITADLNHTVRALAPVKWKMLHFYGKSIMFVFTPTAIGVRFISHSLHFHVWEGETGWGSGSKE